MSGAITIDDVESSLYETGAAATRTRASVKRNVTTFSLAADFWKVNRKLIGSLDSLIDLSEEHRLNNRSLIASSFYDIKNGTEQLKDFWVALSSSTDAELDETLAAIKDEPAESWESVWR